ncbi:MAG: ion channel [Candidatus Competibacterales bacterium]|nr:ion channel [Candidatus Competibacterales bacterium]
MHLLQRLYVVLVASLAGASGRGVALAVAAYIGLSYLLLWGLGERELVAEPLRFLYFMVVTASTVGYGDLSPVTEAGRVATALFVIPLGLSLFALAVGKAAAAIGHYSQRRIRGELSLSLRDHIVVLGWRGARTRALLQLILREQQEGYRFPVVLVVTGDMTNPLPGQVDFVRVATLADPEGLRQACVQQARGVVIDIDQDDVTMAAALSCETLNPRAHITAYFQDEHMATVLKRKCPNIEVIPSVATELLAKAAIDPGSSELHHQLLNVSYGQTQYAFAVPGGMLNIPLRELVIALKDHHEATLIALRRGPELLINPTWQLTASAGDILYYIADERIPEEAVERTLRDLAGSARPGDGG